ncbi:serine hydrolase domain-containing protein [Colwellia piezophila]|uniref:serine hydrolase domain-containing protein n=1 Tax=Colwellia piezophila TaxID=211668 RepID=UPI000360F9E8|nr:serine hydrolase domain-containing protein [Colwellia piezophila]
MEIIDTMLRFLNELFVPAELVFIGIIIDVVLLLLVAKAFFFVGRKFKLISDEKYQKFINKNKAVSKWKKGMRRTLPIVAVVMMFTIGYRLSWQPDTNIKQWQQGDIGQLTTQTNQQLERFIREQDIRDLCVGIIKDKQTYSTCFSQSPAEDNFELNDESIFEIGSITKTFTYAAMIKVLDKHNIPLTGEIGPYLPKAISQKNPQLTEVTWQQLATHSSGLSREPMGLNWPTILTQLNVLRFANAWEPYTTEYVNHYLQSAELNKEQYASYSNLAVGLLGVLISELEGKSYAQLITDEIALPLNMTATRTNRSAYKDKTVQSYGQYRRAGSLVTSTKSETTRLSEALAGAGAISSSLSDMMLYLDDRMQAYQTPIFQQEKYVMPTKKGAKINLGWPVLSLSADNEQKVVIHDGMVGGFVSFIGFDESSEVGIVILANGTRDVTNLGLDVLKRVILK